MSSILCFYIQRRTTRSPFSCVRAISLQNLLDIEFYRICVVDTHNGPRWSIIYNDYEGVAFSNAKQLCQAIDHLSLQTDADIHVSIDDHRCAPLQVKNCF